MAHSSVHDKAGIKLMTLMGGSKGAGTAASAPAEIWISFGFGFDLPPFASEHFLWLKFKSVQTVG